MLEMIFPHLDVFIDKICIAIPRKLINHELIANWKKNTLGFHLIDKGPVMYLAIHSEYINQYGLIGPQIFNAFEQLRQAGVLNVNYLELNLSTLPLLSIPSCLRSSARHYNTFYIAEIEIAFDIINFNLNDSYKRGNGLIKKSSSIYSKDYKICRSSQTNRMIYKRKSFIIIYDRALKTDAQSPCTRTEFRFDKKRLIQANLLSIKQLFFAHPRDIAYFLAPTANKIIRRLKCTDSFNATFLEHIMYSNPLLFQYIKGGYFKNMMVSINVDLPQSHISLSDYVSPIDYRKNINREKRIV